MNPNPMPPPAAPKKKMSGCAIALIIVGGIFVVLVIAAGIGLAVFLRSDTGRKVFDVVDKTGKAVSKGINAPGTKEVRAAGCPQAIVLDMADMAGIVDDFIDAGAGRTGIPDELMVLCQGNFGDKLPSCDEVAKAYVGAVGMADKPFTVSVRRQGNNHALCEVKYSMSGENQGPAEHHP